MRKSLSKQKSKGEVEKTPVSSLHGSGLRKQLVEQILTRK